MTMIYFITYWYPSLVMAGRLETLSSWSQSTNITTATDKERKWRRQCWMPPGTFGVWCPQRKPPCCRMGFGTHWEIVLQSVLKQVVPDAEWRQLHHHMHMCSCQKTSWKRISMIRCPTVQQCSNATVCASAQLSSSVELPCCNESINLHVEERLNSCLETFVFVQSALLSVQHGWDVGEFEEHDNGSCTCCFNCCSTANMWAHSSWSASHCQCVKTLLLSHDSAGQRCAQHAAGRKKLESEWVRDDSKWGSTASCLVVQIDHVNLNVWFDASSWIALIHSGMTVTLLCSWSQSRPHSNWTARPCGFTWINWSLCFSDQWQWGPGPIFGMHVSDLPFQSCSEHASNRCAIGRDPHSQSDCTLSLGVTTASECQMRIKLLTSTETASTVLWSHNAKQQARSSMCFCKKNILPDLFWYSKAADFRVDQPYICWWHPEPTLPQERVGTFQMDMGQALQLCQCSL